MRKFLFFLILLPAFAALAHDAYLYSQDQSKGFRLSDIGFLWDRYDKDSHDQWKKKLSAYEETVREYVPVLEDDVSDALQAPSGEESLAQPYEESFTQTNSRDAEPIVEALQDETASKVDNPSIMQPYVAWVLEQKAVFVFAGIAFIIYVLNAICALLFCSRNSMDANAPRTKKGQFNYKRK